jgi:MoxR-like ATPase
VQAAPRPEQSFKDLFDALANQLERILRGKRRAVHLSLVCLFSEGHLLIEDVPGVGKTSLAKAIARSIGGSWRRVQFTPDLLPSDVTGVSVWDRTRSDFEFRPGGVFAHVVLADEINRASPKTQSALLEAMEERQVTVDSKTYPLPRPFLVIATQNPVELEGTYPLPEAQLDRFLLRLRIGYPDREAELAILDGQGVDAVEVDDLEPVTDAETIAGWIQELSRVHVSPELRGYVVDLVEATRHHRDLMLGVSPRGAIALQRASRALAASVGRSYVIADDVKVLAASVLEHRLLMSSEAMMRGVHPADVLAQILDSVPVPATPTD